MIVQDNILCHIVVRGSPYHGFASGRTASADCASCVETHWRLSVPVKILAAVFPTSWSVLMECDERDTQGKQAQSESQRHGEHFLLLAANPSKLRYRCEPHQSAQKRTRPGSRPPHHGHHSSPTLNFA
ncbi:hypothetical protein SKAU_G00309700 [Synaphobranchus kaupii]|uniref:Uncharacterized protein n=1 Tax=Synaphobranchus kaupii TaxID=118154 RepID=A0A9Q1ERD5_SYNKA|nr:hypothetical protein SKAU_G00309700 [Synaphobranchus kaupii]